MRNPNVQQQNEATKRAIRELTDSFRGDPLRRAWLIVALQQASLAVDQGILAQVHQVAEQDGDLFKGYWLTTDQRFFTFEVLVPRRDEKPIIVEIWKDVTADMPINGYLPGLGKSFGYLALEVLAEITGTMST